MTLWAFSSSGREAPRLFECSSHAILRVSHHFDAHALADLAWAYSNIGHIAPHLFTGIAKHCTNKVEILSSLQLASIVWAFSSASQEAPELFSAVARESLMRLAEFDLPNLVTLACSLAMANQPAPELFEGIASQVQHRADQLLSEHVAPLRWAYSVLGYTSSSKLETAIAAQQLQLKFPRSDEPTYEAQALWRKDHSAVTLSKSPWKDGWTPYNESRAHRNYGHRGWINYLLGELDHLNHKWVRPEALEFVLSS